MDRKAHWERVYTTRLSTEVRWYQPAPTRSLALLREIGATTATTVLDVGGGDSTLVDADVTRAELPAHAYDAWHDRAVVHFLTSRHDRARYTAIAAAVRPGGTLLIATFAPDGPARCSALDVTRYSAEELAREFDAAFTLVRDLADVHRTPSGGEQRFTVAMFRRRSPAQG